jgi:pimeloyl-ACP methyl ester carboxylesterase
MSYVTRYLLALILFTTACASLASDLAKEKRWAEQVVDAIFDGEALMLSDGELEFLAIYTPAASEQSTDAVILLHGLGVHPDWDQVIRPLRTGLPELGWSTLSLQMPVLANDVGYEEYAPLFKEVPGRIEAGIKYLKKNGAKRIVIISHSLGAAMGSYYLANHHPDLVSGFVGIGMSGGGKHTGMDNVVLLTSVDVPVLDLYGENDLDSVLGSANARKQSVENRKASASNAKSVQKMVPGADHFFDGQNADLLNEVSSWLKNL